MRSLVFYTIAVCVFMFLSSSCGGGRTEITFSGQGDTLDIRHASYLQVVEYPGYTVVNLRNPWDTLKVLHTYILMPREKVYDSDSLPVGTVVRVPLQRSVVYTSVHCALLEELGALSSIVGVCDSQYIYRPAVREQLRLGGIRHVGSGIFPDVERIIELQPEALLLSPFENSGGYGTVGRLEVPIVECADYMETSALGRAEWMRFYGRLYGCASRADSLFAAVEHDYLMWKHRAQGCSERPTVFTDLPAGSSAWYVPGGNSTIGGMYADAGARYLFADNANSGSVPLSFETVYAEAKDADFWLIRYHAPVDRTYASLAMEHQAYTHFSAYRTRRMYGCNTANSTFYEEIPFHPERLLAEFAYIFHPELRDDAGLYYYKALE